MKKEKLRILIVDDDRRMARTLVDILRLNGYEAEASYSGCLRCGGGDEFPPPLSAGKE